MRDMLIITLLLCVMGCATPYQKQTMFSATGGYYEKELSTDVYRVGFGGNGWTEISTTIDYAILRSSELTLEKGKKYFMILEGGGERKDDYFWTGYTVGSASKPVAEITIRILDSQPATGKVYDAAETIKSIRQKNNLDDRNKVKK